MTSKSFQKSSEEIKIKISGPELVFGYLLRLANLLLGITVFTLLIHFDQEYASTIEKVRAASGFSMSVMIYLVCPAALLFSAVSKLAYHTWADPWRKMGSSEKWTAQQFIPKPKSKIISKIQDADIPECEVPERELPEPDDQNIPVEE